MLCTKPLFALVPVCLCACNSVLSGEEVYQLSSFNAIYSSSHFCFPSSVPRLLLYYCPCDWHSSLQWISTESHSRIYGVDGIEFTCGESLYVLSDVSTIACSTQDIRYEATLFITDYRNKIWDMEHKILKVLLKGRTWKTTISCLHDALYFDFTYT